MTDARQIQKALAGVEDLLLGESTVTQTRNGVTYTITKINSDKLPYSGDPTDAAYQSVKTILDSHRIRSTYSFANDGGAIGDIVLFELPNNSTITRVWYEVVTAPSSGGSATIAFGVATDDPTGILIATAYDNAAFSAGYHAATPDNTVANFTTKSTAARNVVMTIAGATLTAGVIYIWCEYLTSE